MLNFVGRPLAAEWKTNIFGSLASELPTLAVVRGRLVFRRASGVGRPLVEDSELCLPRRSAAETGRRAAEGKTEISQSLASELPTLAVVRGGMDFRRPPGVGRPLAAEGLLSTKQVSK